MKQIFLTMAAIIGLNWTHAQNVGIGTAGPLERLHVAGNVRVDGLAGVGTRVVGANANGTLVVVAAGANGQVFTQTVGGPAWQNGTDWALLGNAGTNPATNFMGSIDAVDVVFRTANLERMRLNASGNLRIGSTNYIHQCGGSVFMEDTRVRFSVVGGFSSMGNFNHDPLATAAAVSTTWMNGVGSLVVGMNRNAGTSNVDLWNNSDPNNGAAALGATDRGFSFRNFRSGGAVCTENLLATLQGNGNLILNQTAGLGGQFFGFGFNNISDQRAKEGIQPIGSVLDKVDLLNPVSYRYRAISHEPGKPLHFDSPTSDAKDIGFLAQEIYQVFPQVVQKPADESIDLWSVDYSKLSPILVKAIQELRAEVELLKQQNAELMQRIEK